ncbi:Ig-like domain-containing protein [Vallitalea pronyensis]|uniref:Ig-like domain-containing protein n=1 Tax=Vallitalea pronyensis TaxID=1348613 RepID=A0A8J8SGQ8_9FIRM|nr:Ig-like domain-containing alpha-2-macroglobulin family protein [Vallitalea pronyensis]QUI22617.1 Ig-like domain-containing protein [Vallitalea pronyensis]
MKKKIVSLVIMIALVVTIFTSRSLHQDIVVNAEEFRNGYALIPDQFDSTGIHLDTTFLLKPEGSTKLTSDDVQKKLQMEPAIPFAVTKVEEGFRITLEKSMNLDSLYQFSFEDVSWVFQTRSEFALLGVLPRHESSNVPVNTGIEFYFNQANAEIEKFFQIEPKVSGKFETHGKAVVFAPKGGLKPGTIYTVTLKKGASLKGSEQQLKEDFVFQFETSPEGNSEQQNPLGQFNFLNIVNEFGTKEVPRVPINYYVYDTKKAKDDMDINVYAYKTIDDFTSALKTYSEVPRWSYLSREKTALSVKGLSKVQSFTQPLRLQEFDEHFIELPEALPAGYYVIDGHWKDINFQTLIQVTDISFYYIGGGHNTPIPFAEKSTNNPSGGKDNLLWINDLKTGKSIEGAQVARVGATDKYTSDASGVVQMASTKEEDDQSAIYTINDGERSAVFMSMGIYGRKGYNEANHWRYLQTDRGLYQPDDTVEFFGFLQGRYKDEEINELTIEITQSNWYFWKYMPYAGDDLALEKVTVKADHGFFDGKIQLPYLDEGSYQVSVRHKDEIVASQYIQVEQYTKPAYKLEMDKDKEAIFIGEKVTFNINTLFFEGTPVANLEVNYNLNGMEHRNGTEKSDTKGQVNVDYKPDYVKDTQGIQHMNISAFAKLPESGEIYGNEDVRVFVNDIHVNIEAKREDKEGTLSLDVHEYDLSRLNNGTAEHDNDYLGSVKPGQTITGTIYKNEWIKREVGEYYDFINKVVRKRYEYDKKKTKVKDITLTTDQEGKATTSLQFDQITSCYYSAELNTVDGNGRKMTFDAHFSKRWHYTPYEGDAYKLQSDKDVFDVDEDMTLTFVNKDEPLKGGNYLYMTAQNGIHDYHVSDQSTYTRTFDASLIPNATIRGVYFNGKTYVQQDFSARFNIESKKLVFEAKTDKDAYKPGETCTVTLTAKIYSKEEGKHIPAKDVYVNASLVDEALLKLNDQEINTLEELYSHIDSGLGMSYMSHSNRNHNVFMYRGYGMVVEELTKEAMPQAANMKFDMAMDDSLESGSVYVRSVFKDTALFKTIKLNEQGEGTFSFTLPDNVTSWRMTFAGISKSLQAGTNKEEVIVSLPYFINTSLAKTYLVGDQPFVGVSVYGKALKEGEKIDYLVTAEGTDFKATATGKAFERVNIPLWEMKEGSYDLVIKAKSESGYTDGLQQTINVVTTYHEMQVADYYDLKKGLKIKTNDKGLTTIMMLDQGKAKFLPSLYGLAYSGGKRVDQKYLGYQVSAFLKEHFDLDEIIKDEVKISDYEIPEGGIALLPYADSDLETTVKLLPIIKDQINTQKMTLYLRNELQNKASRNHAAALYGLAILGEPVLNELERYDTISNNTLKDQLYLALAYSEVGDTYKAKIIYDNKVAKHVESYDAVKRVKYGKSTDDYLVYSALTMVLASKLNMEDRDLFHAYVTSEYSEEVLTNIEEFVYVMQEFDKVTDEKAKVTYRYQGKTVEKVLEGGWYENIKIPSKNLSALDIQKVEGDVALVAIYNKSAVIDRKQDEHITINRTYYDYATGKQQNTFNESDIVKVVLDVDIDQKAIDNYYTITDYVPSGLAPIANSRKFGLRDTDNYYYYKDVEGQKVTMHIGKNYKDKPELYYYARVVTPGTYKAEGTIVSGSRIRDSFKILEMSEIKINHE